MSDKTIILKVGKRSLELSELAQFPIILLVDLPLIILFAALIFIMFDETVVSPLHYAISLIPSFFIVHKLIKFLKREDEKKHIKETVVDTVKRADVEHKKTKIPKLSFASVYTLPEFLLMNLAVTFSGFLILYLVLIYFDIAILLGLLFLIVEIIYRVKCSRDTDKDKKKRKYFDSYTFRTFSIFSMAFFLLSVFCGLNYCLVAGETAGGNPDKDVYSSEAVVKATITNRKRGGGLFFHTILELENGYVALYDDNLCQKMAAGDTISINLYNGAFGIPIIY